MIAVCSDLDSKAKRPEEAADYLSNYEADNLLSWELHSGILIFGISHALFFPLNLSFNFH